MVKVPKPQKTPRHKEFSLVIVRVLCYWLCAIARFLFCGWRSLLKRAIAN
ncbi:hypothetical protein JYQ62_22295 [Nostoc sp. UHCC 0702]|nr:hypothetical protein JYQ62_22295 [Nostoc sp. UHCC 0702]